MVGGGIANTFLAATGVAVGKSLHEPDMLDVAKRLLAQAKARGVGIPIPTDVVVAREFAATAKAETKPATAVGADEMILDIGPASARARGGHRRHGRHGHLERAARRVRVRRVRRRDEGAGRGDREEPGVLDRGRRRHARRDREVRHRARRLLYFDRWRRLPRVRRGQDAASGRRARTARTRRCDDGKAHQDRRDARPRHRPGARDGRPDRGRRRPGPRQLLARQLRRARAAHRAARGLPPRKAGRVVGILGDLRGPKVRIECFAAGRVMLVEGERIHARPVARPECGAAPRPSASPTSRCRATCARATRCC